ncbi:hypothetical protein KKF92_04215 [Patescibacteria group bacterium]|nr:hypothetical protein [Patescibacteria group bacterium]
MKFIIFGLGREGKSSYHFLRRIFDDVEIILTDDHDLDNLSGDWKSILVQDSMLSFATPNHLPLSVLTEAIMVVTPGIPPRHKLLAHASSIIPITTNAQLFLETVLPNRAQHSLIKAHLPKFKKQPLVIGVTGTKGKSTTTNAIHHLLKTAGFVCLLGGNIGLPPLDLIDSIQTLTDQDPDKQVIAVLEFSSQQLSRINISPQIAVIQAISPEHMDYFSDFEAYAAAKSQITAFQRPEDTVIFNTDNLEARKVAAAAKGEQLAFSLKTPTITTKPKSITARPIGNLSPTPSTKPDSITSRSLNKPTPADLDATIKPICQLIGNQIMYQNQPVISLDQLQIKGRHNSLNLMPAIIIGHQFHISNQKIASALSTLEPLPHRLETVATLDEVTYINDSLSTNPVAAIAALKSFPHQPIILIAGGFDRGQSFQDLVKTIRQTSVKAVILLPDTGHKIKTLLEAERDRSSRSTPPPQVKLVDNLKSAVKLAKQLAESGDVVLMSPASASFGQFKDYADRGEKFRKFVIG